jgi:hypothetical protein
MLFKRSSKYGRPAAYGMAVAAISLLATIPGNMAAGSALINGCVTRDAQVMMMLESSNVSTRHMNGTLNTIMHARMMCFDGQVMDALALYDDIAHSIAPDWLASSPPQ